MADTKFPLAKADGSAFIADGERNGADGWRLRVFTLRKHLNLSKERFAILVGVSPRTVYRWEAGRSLAKSRAVISRIESLERMKD